MMFLWKLYNYVLRAHFCVMMQWKSAAHRFSNRGTTTKSFNKKWTKLINEIFNFFSRVVFNGFTLHFRLSAPQKLSVLSFIDSIPSKAGKGLMAFELRLP